MSLINVLNYARENKISDIHITPCIKARYESRLCETEDKEFYFSKAEEIIIEYTEIYFRKDGEIIKFDFKEEEKEFYSVEVDELASYNEDFSFIDKLGRRYRVNGFIENRNVGTERRKSFVIRVIPQELPKLKGNFINKLIDEKILNLKNGLVLVTGVTGSGKSTTLANFIEKFNENKRYKILTLEDPIEYVYENKKSLIVQREIDSEDFKFALKSSLRQDPDIIVVGEIRDEESLYAALNLAETGHLVFSTLHTMNTVETINRLISMVKTDKKDFIRDQLASLLRFVFSQELIKIKGEINPIFEILNNTKAVSNLIAMNKLNQIPTLIESGAENYMITKEKYIKIILE